MEPGTDAIKRPNAESTSPFPGPAPGQIRHEAVRALCDDIAMFCSPVDLRYSRHTVSTGWLQARADSVPVKDA